MTVRKLSSGTYALGKKAARPDAVQFKLSRYLTGALPTPADPKNFGHQQMIGTNKWGMLGNDNYGDCVWAGAGHEHLLMAALANKKTNFSTASILKCYSECTGFDPRRPETDQGTDMQAGASYRRTKGILDASGHRHQIAAYLDVARHTLDEVMEATFLFGATGVGIEFPDFAMDQFNAGEPWDVKAHQKAPQDGHYIPVIGFEDGNLVCVTWGRKQLMTPAFFAKYSDEAIAYVNPEYLVNGKTPEGLNAAELQKDLSQIAA